MIDLYGYSLSTIFFTGLAVILGVSEVGWQLGTRWGGRSSSNLPTLESAALGLLALIIGFTFAMSLARFEARRDAVLNEANAIGTTALRARLLPEPNRTETLNLLREYVHIRISVIERHSSLAEMVSVLDRSNVLQEALWQQAKSMAGKDKGMIPTGLFIQSLNEMIDDQGKRLAVLRNRVPNIVLLALFGIAAVAGGFAGYANGFDAKRTRLPVYIMGTLICGVIYLILDLDRPSSGFITNNQQAMIDTAATIAGFSD
jgi:hypothetical protein